MTRIVGTAALVFLGIRAAQFPGAEPGGERAADKPAEVPDAAAQAASLKLIKDLYKDDYAKAKAAPAKLTFAKKLLQQGIGTRDDPAARYVLLIEARDLAIDAGDAKTSLDAIDEISRRYLAVAALEMKLQAIEKVSRSAKTPEALRQLTESAFELTDAALQVSNYTVAKKAAALATATAGKAKSKHLAVWAAFRTREAAECEKEYGPAKEAIALLRQKPADPDASLTAGRFRALLKGDWDGGMSLLKSCGDSELKDLAVNELTASFNAGDRAALGDRWVTAAEKMQPPFKSRALSRAAYWFERSLFGLEGLTRAKYEDRLRRSLGVSGDLKPGLVAELFDGRELKRKKAVRTDPQVSFDWGFAPPDPNVPADRFSIRWTGNLVAAAPGKYTLTLRSDDGARLWLDDEPLIDQWGFGGHDGHAAVYLTDKSHPMRIEYCDDGGYAKVALSWSLEGSGADSPVPAYAFFHDAQAERAAKK